MNENTVGREAIIAKAKDEAEGMDEPFKSNFAVLVEWLLDKLPPVTPKQRTGKWIKSRDRYDNYHFTCPFCEYDIATKYAGAWGDNYCPNCGAKMEGEEE